MCDFASVKSKISVLKAALSRSVSMQLLSTYLRLRKLQTPLTTNQSTSAIVWLWHESGKPVLFPNMTIMLILF